MDIRVSDGISYDTTQVKISILNINDMAPVFEPSEYSATVMENVDCDKSINKVSTTVFFSIIQGWVKIWSILKCLKLC